MPRALVPFLAGLVFACAAASPRETARALAASGDVAALVDWVSAKVSPRADPDERIRLVERHHAAAAALVGLGDAAVPELARALVLDPSPSVAAVLAEIGTPAAIDALTRAIDRAPREARAGLVGALARTDGPGRAGTLLSLALDPSPRVRAEVARGLGRAHDDGVYSSTVTAALSRSLADPDPDVRLVACQAVAGRWGDGLERALAGLLAKDPSPEAIRCAVGSLLRMGAVGLAELEGASPVEPSRVRAVFDGFVDAGPVGLEATYRWVGSSRRRVVLSDLVPGGIDVRDAARRAGDCPFEELRELGGLGGPTRAAEVVADAMSCPELLRFTVLSTLGPGLDAPSAALPALIAFSAACRQEITVVRVEDDLFGEERALAERRAAHVTGLAERCRAFGVPFLARAMGAPEPRVRLLAVRVAADPRFELTRELETRCRDVAPDVRRAAAVALEAHGTKCPGAADREAGPAEGLDVE